MEKISSSFKDNSNQVYIHDSKIIRTINVEKNSAYPKVFENGVIDKFIEKGDIVNSKLISPLDYKDKKNIYIEHEKINFISYPYEWSNIFLYHAGLKTIEINKNLLKYGYHLIDANAFNIQFINGKPILIDLGSIVNYDNKFGWQGMQEFICSFFNPLYFMSRSSIRFNDVYKSFLNGIPSSFIYKTKNISDFFRLRFLLNIFSHEQLMKNIHKRNQNKNKNVKSVKYISIEKYKSILDLQESFLKKTYSDIKSTRSYWDSYASKMHNYSDTDIEKKRKIIINYIKKYKPKCLLDLGCNDGYYSLLAHQNGIEKIIAVDNDENCIERLAQKVIDSNLPILPLIIDFTNESPLHGWSGSERYSFSHRAKECDGVIALALVHHLVIGNNIPMDQAIKWIIQSSKHGVIEFVKKEDSQIKEMLSSRKDIFEDYNIDTFRDIMKKNVRITNEKILDSNTRVIFIYEK